ncbi:facilitated trehalose transporter Tret1-like [Drosophila busckii]|uniref:facilitated trehalose transporter Tret1-like n=1 Tax=Drosophila busckii TaxID=30019 RepID=UPI0014333F40|nr:facilitated trehalose transporter Tret1-like [Drosophila busckii]
MTAIFENSNCLLSRRNRYQFLATLLVNFATFSHGLGMGWMSPVMLALQTENSPLDFDVLVEQLSWIGSLLGIGSVIGNLLAGCLQARFGRKPVMYALIVPYVCFWLLSYYAQSVEYLYLARLLAGVTGGAGYIVFPIYISEISDANIRGRLSSLIMLSVNIGVLAGYILSHNVAYALAPFWAIPFPICYFISNLFLPETPHYLIMKRKFAAAEKSFRFYKNIDAADKAAMWEFEDIKHKLTSEQGQQRSCSTQDFVTPAALKAYATAAVLIICNQFTGTSCFTTYMANIFAVSHTTLDVNMCTIIIGVVQIVGTYTATLLCDRCGRKILLLCSTLGASISLGIFGVYVYLAKDYDLSAVGWLPLLLLSLDVFVCNIGLVGVFFVQMVELMPSKIRSVVISIVVVLLSCMVFVTLKIFPICMDRFGVEYTMWGCSSVGLFGFIYFGLFLTETKGKALLD